MASCKRRANISKTYEVENVCRMSVLREYGCPCAYRDDIKILKKLICQGDLEYRKVWSHKSNKAISVEGTRIHFENYSTCYSGDMSWNMEDESFVMKSTLQPTLTAQERQVGARRSVLLALCVFAVAPLSFVALLEIDKTIFGSDASGAMISYDLLYILHQSGHIRVYSFQTILNQFQLYERTLNQVDPESNEVIGRKPLGLPINVKVTERPPCLFELRCANHDLNVGGIPWHYIYSPREMHHDYFRVCKLDTQQLAVNGAIEMDGMNTEPDKIMFHFTDPSRVIQIGQSVFKAFKIIQNDNGTTELKHEFSIQSEGEPGGDPPRMGRHITSSGRVVKRPVYDDVFDYSEYGFNGANYEHELDLLCLTLPYQEEEDGIPYGRVCLHDNDTGKLIREIRIMHIAEHYEHEVSIDLDTIVQVVKLSPSNFQCFVYKLMPKVKENQHTIRRVHHSEKIHDAESNRRTTRQQRRRQQSS